MNTMRLMGAIGIMLAAGCVNPGRAAEVTHLFTNWYLTDAGNAVFRVDRTKVDPQALKVLEQVRDYYKIQLTEGDTPPERAGVPTGVKLRAEMGKMADLGLKQENPWESGGASVSAVIQDGGRYRMWYGCSVAARETVRVLPNGRKKLGSEGGSSGLCYAESEDGLHWKKPSLGLVEFHGSKDNNIIASDPIIGGGSIFLDPSAPADERYKVVSNTDIRTFEPTLKASYTVPGAAVSPDGIHWKRLPEPLWQDTFNNDGSPVVYHDTQTGKYVMFTRANYPRRRSIARAETTDFRRWPHPVVVLMPGPDDDPAVDFYDNPYVRYPGSANGHLMLVSIYHRDTSLVDLRLATSSDGDAWNWLSPHKVVTLGKQGSWNAGELYAQASMVQLPDGRVAVPVIGYSWGHEEYWRAKFEQGRERQEGSGWVTWEDGRIAGIEAEKAGEFTTQPLRCTGKPIQVNARTGYSGSVQVDLVVEIDKGVTKPGLRSKPMTGDLRWRTLEWEQGDPASLAGKTVRLCFRLYDAKVFGMRADGLELVSPYNRK